MFVLLFSLYVLLHTVFLNNFPTSPLGHCSQNLDACCVQICLREPHQVHPCRSAAAVAGSRPARAQGQPSGRGRPSRLLLPPQTQEAVSKDCIA